MTMTTTTLSASLPLAASAMPVQVEGDPVSDLARWVADQVAKHAVRLVLTQKVGDGAHQTVDEWTTVDLVDTRALAETIYGTGLREAQTLRACVLYVVFALRADRAEPVGRYNFRIDAGSGWMQPPERANEAGITAMLMAHTDASARLALGHSRGILDQYERLLTQVHTQHATMLEKAHARIAILETREIEVLELRDKLQSAAHQRELELLRLKRRDEVRKLAIEKGLDKLGKLAARFLPGQLRVPAQPVAQIAAAKTEPPTAPADPIDLFTQFVASIDSDQFGKIAQLLSPDQVVLLWQLYDVALARAAAASPSAVDMDPTATSAPPAPPQPTDSSPSPAAGTPDPIPPNPEPS